MGGGGTFCVVESAPRGRFKLGLDSLGDGDKFLLRVTVFHAKYVKNGELLMTTTAAAHGPCQSYLRAVPRLHSWAQASVASLLQSR
ncbi:hypothetical protein E2562_024960 [Oryza meyeriana var. granulata]|uniref:Uncharacterized protein n=1 Tax=Oryza meyeriana var. granulata TaxID=110450 RepID=A0A6G1DM26_9ORYZ|nr:hypothetical protein E2562_024960 [Oryza meyeriana var. granulata]